MSLSIGVILGSTRPQRNGEAVAKWFMEQTKQFPDAKFSLIDLQAVGLPLLDEGNTPMMHQYENQHTKDWAKLIASFDGFIVVTAEYNHSVPAALKNAFDYLYAEWNKKPIGFVSYGGASAGSRSVEHLRLIAIELRMVPVRDQVLIYNVWSAFENGSLKPEALAGDLDGMVKDVLWYAQVLKKAKQAK